MLAESKMAEVKKQTFRHIVRIVNTDLDGNKPIMHALKKIKGIGPVFANSVCLTAGMSKTAKTGNLSKDEIDRLDEIIRDPAKFGFPEWMLNRRKDYESGKDRHILTSDLDFIHNIDLRRMKKTKSYKGLRHQAGLPVRGQRTRSNFRRNKGKVTGVKRKR